MTAAAPDTAPSDPVFLRACRGLPVSHTPIWLMRQAGRYQPEYRALREKVSFLELCKTPRLSCDVTVRAALDMGVDAAILFADILLIVEPMGLPLEFNKGEGPSLPQPVRDLAAISRLRVARARTDLGFVMEAVALIRKELPAHIPLIGFAGAPFTVASYMIEGGSSRHFVQTRTLMYREPEAWHQLMTKLTDSTVDYLSAQVDAGAQALQLFDSWVGCLSPSDYRTYVGPHMRRLFSALGDRVPTIHFGVGTALLLEEMAFAGGDVIGVDSVTPLAWARARLGGRPVQGNLDPTTLFADLPTLATRTKEILNAAGTAPGHVFNLGHGILPGTPVESVKALVAMVHEMTSRS